jgi:hypothetical protein
MKIIDVPSTGKYGLQVRMPGRYGQVVRAWVSPSNPRTAAQLAIRTTFTSQAARYAGLTQTRQDAWATAAALYQSRSSLGQSGPLTGFQLFMKLNATLLRFGQEPVDEPTARPEFAPNAPQSLVITNTGGTIAVKLTCPTSPGTNTVVRAGAPQKSGRRALPGLRILGMAPAPAQGSSDITSLYTARYGSPPPGTRLFVQVSQMTDGWESGASQFSAVVPAAT